MFFKKKKAKLDPKVRFQHKQFASKLNTARTYKRQVRAVPETGLDKFLARIGLESRWTQGVVGLVLAGVIYILYVPNFLSLQTITINGLSESQARDFEIAIRDEIASTPFYNPQRNLLFLSEELIKSAALRVPSINKASAIKKNIGSQTLVVDAESKFEKFLVATPERVYDVYNDGTLKAEAGVPRADWEAVDNTSMTKVMLYQNINAENGRLFFHWDLYDHLIELSELVKTVDRQQLAYITFKEPSAREELVEIKPVIEETEEVVGEEVAEEPTEEPEPEPEVVEPLPNLDLPINNSEVHLVFYKNNDKRRSYRVIFDVTRPAKESIEDLKLLLSQTSPDRYNQLFYIDMRLETKAFVCVESAPCAK